jgi:Tfp pilus assembly protein FimV
MKNNFIENFENFSVNEKKLSSGIKDQITAKNPEHPFLKAFKSDEEFNKIKELWDNDEQDEAARLLRSKLTKMANTKVGTALLLMIAGSSLASAGYNAMEPIPKDPPVPKPEPTPTPPKPTGEVYTIKKGDSIWKIAKNHLPSGASNSDIMDYTRQIASENGMNVKLIDGVLTKTPGDPDLIFTGGKLVLNKFAAVVK